jgi:hypothetical protein
VGTLQWPMSELRHGSPAESSWIAGASDRLVGYWSRGAASEHGVALAGVEEHVAGCAGKSHDRGGIKIMTVRMARGL